MALLSLDRHDVLETIRQSNGLHEAFLRVAKLPAVGEYKTLTNADRIRSMTDEELAYFMANIEPCRESAWLDWLKAEASE